MQRLGEPWSSYHRVWDFSRVLETHPSHRGITLSTKFAQNTLFKDLDTVTFSLNLSCSAQYLLGVRMVTSW